MASDKDFSVFLQDRNLPVCVLDEKWHKLFSLKGKPDDIADLEEELNGLLKKQGKINNDIKELKKLKTQLMQNIVSNMEGTHEENAGRKSSKMLDKDKRMLDEANKKLAEYDDDLLELPREIAAVNKELMMLTVEYCYEKLRINLSEIKEISGWIAQVRVDLKKNIIKKQNREINSRQIYAYMHGIFGAEMMDVFDLDNDDVDMSILEPPKKAKAKEQDGEKDAGAAGGDGAKQAAGDARQAEKKNADAGS